MALLEVEVPEIGEVAFDAFLAIEEFFQCCASLFIVDNRCISGGISSCVGRSSTLIGSTVIHCIDWTSETRLGSIIPISISRAANTGVTG